MLPIPSWDQLWMRHAYLISTKSKDTSTKIGAVIIKDNRIIGAGYNGQPRNCDDDIKERNDRPTKYFYFEHAERNAVFSCSYFGIASRGGKIYTQGTPCADCARAIIQAGLIELIIHKEWEEKFLERTQWQESCKHSMIMLKEVGVQVRYLSGLLGVKTMIGEKAVEL
jgi:dCMP deaminase